MGALGFGLFILGFCGWRWTARIQKLDLPTDEWSFKIGEVTVTLTRALVIVLALIVTDRDHRLPQQDPRRVVDASRSPTTASSRR